MWFCGGSFRTHTDHIKPVKLQKSNTKELSRDLPVSTCGLHMSISIIAINVQRDIVCANKQSRVWINSANWLHSLGQCSFYWTLLSTIIQACGWPRQHCSTWAIKPNPIESFGGWGQYDVFSLNILADCQIKNKQGCRDSNLLPCTQKSQSYLSSVDISVT